VYRKSDCQHRTRGSVQVSELLLATHHGKS